MIKLSAKEKILNYLTKDSDYNTLSVAQARARFGIKNVAARVHELRKDGYPIYSNVRARGDGSKVNIYRIGKPSRQMKKEARTMGVKIQNVFA